MTLKLIDKDLKSKYAEVLYKNELSYVKEIDRRFKRLSIDFVRNSQMVDNGSQVFLNRIRQKRHKWTQDDLNFRDHYRLVCRNVTNKKLDNLKQAINANTSAKKVNQKKIDPVIESKLKILQDQLQEHHHENYNNSFGSEPILNTVHHFGKNNTKTILVPKLPDLRNITVHIDEDLYSKYSKSDREFLEKYPARVELTDTDLGKQFVNKEQTRFFTLTRQKQKNSRLQTNAVKDSRFRDLVSFLQ